MTYSNKAVAIVGATASGKSAVAHKAALALSPNVEIICVDAMTVYRGMDIATAKPSMQERSEVQYHLLDVVDPSEEFTLAEFQDKARAATKEIWVRGHAVLYVGGTGLYGRAVIDDFEIPKQYPQIRETLEREAEFRLAELYDELRSKDPVAASKMEPNNTRRIVRALEVVRGSGLPFSSFGDEMTAYKESRVSQVGLLSDALSSQTAIAERFRQWLDEGLLEEVQQLLRAPLGLSRTARQAVGYKELFAHFEQGLELNECVTDALSASRKLARRQRAWFRRDPRIEWFEDRVLAQSRVEELLHSDTSIVRE